MSNILETIADYARLRVERNRAEHPLGQLQEACAQAGPGQGEAFRQALAKPGVSFICEVKKASPSKGIISPDFPYLDIARDYQAAGADCISCLTEPKWFLGSDEIFCQIRAQVDIPMLRKDFVVDAYQLYQARLMGANTVLLICALLGPEKVERYLEVCDRLGLAALVETHDEEEMAFAAKAGAKIIGVNNRNLKDFSVDVNNSARLRALAPPGLLFVAESGIRTREDVAALERQQVDAVLVGETLMRAPDKKQMLDLLRGAV